MQQTRPTIRRLAVSAALVTGLALVGGCGDDDDEASTDDTEATSPDTDAPTDDTEAGTDDTEADTDGDAEAGAVLIAGYAFDPTPVTVQAGDTVTWTNDDDFAHTTTADDDLWDSSDIANGDSFEFTFDEPGTYAYHCAIHNFMEGEVVVE
jgi:plastocyanin